MKKQLILFALFLASLTGFAQTNPPPDQKINYWLKYLGSDATLYPHADSVAVAAQPARDAAQDATIAGKAATSHTHTSSNITDFLASVRGALSVTGSGGTYNSTTGVFTLTGGGSGGVSSFTALTDKPTTLTGYGISDATSASLFNSYTAAMATTISGKLTQTQADALYKSISYAPTKSDVGLSWVPSSDPGYQTGSQVNTSITTAIAAATATQATIDATQNTNIAAKVSTTTYTTNRTTDQAAIVAAQTTATNSLTLSQGVERLARGVTQPLFTPTSLTGIMGWFDASHPLFTNTSLTAVAAQTGDLVGYWSDGTINSKTVSSSATSISPTLNLTLTNGKPAVVFDGVNDQMIKTNFFVSTDAFARGLTVAFVGGADIATGLRAVFSDGVSMYGSRNGLTGGAGMSFSSDITRTGGAGNIAGAASLGVYLMRYNPTLSQLTLVYDDQGAAAGLNSTASSQTITASGSLSALVGHSLILGALVNNNYLKGWLSELVFYDRALTDEEMRQLLEYEYHKWGFNTPMVTGLSNSLWSGSGSTSGPTQAVSLTGDNLPSYLLQLGGGAYKIFTEAVPGRLTSDINANRKFFSELHVFPAGRPGVDIAFEATNEQAIGNSETRTYDQSIQMAKRSKQMGNRVIMLTMLPRYSDSIPLFKAGRAAYNARILANYKLEGFADTVINLEAITMFQSNTNTAFWSSDGVHMKSPGYYQLALIVDAAIRNQLTKFGMTDAEFWLMLSLLLGVGFRTRQNKWAVIGGLLLLGIEASGQIQQGNVVLTVYRPVPPLDSSRNLLGKRVLTPMSRLDSLRIDNSMSGTGSTTGEELPSYLKQLQGGSYKVLTDGWKVGPNGERIMDRGRSNSNRKRRTKALPVRESNPTVTISERQWNSVLNRLSELENKAQRDARKLVEVGERE